MSCSFGPIRIVVALGVVSIAAFVTGCNHEVVVDEVPNPGATPAVIWFPRQSEGFSMDDARLGGELKLVSGCLRVIAEPTTDYLVVWPADFSLDFTEDGNIDVLDDQATIAVRVGKQVVIGGGESPESDDQELGECPGPFWYAGETVREAQSAPTLIGDGLLDGAPVETLAGVYCQQEACLDP